MKAASQRSLLIALGIAVAVIILFTAFYFSEGALSLNKPTREQGLPKKATSEAVVKKASGRILPLLRFLHK